MNKSSSLLLHLHLHLLHLFIMNKSSNLTKKKKAYGLGALCSYFLGHFQKKKKKFINQIFSNSFKNSRFPNFSKKKFKIFNSFEKFKFSKFKKKKKIFIKFFFRNRKIWSSSIFSSGATSSQLSTPQHSSKHGICHKLGAFARYAKVFSMNNSVTNWKYLFCRY